MFSGLVLNTVQSCISRSHDVWEHWVRWSKHQYPILVSFNHLDQIWVVISLGKGFRTLLPVITRAGVVLYYGPLSSCMRWRCLDVEL